MTQNEEALDRFLLCAPEVSRIVTSFNDQYCQKESSKSKLSHYHLATSMSLRIFKNAAVVKESIVKHCEGNPFSNNTTLCNIASSMQVPEAATDDIINRDVKGEEQFQKFLETRLHSETATMSISDRIPKMKLKTFSTCNQKTVVRIRDKLVKLREDRQLLARFLIVMESRPEMATHLKDAIGNYEFSAIPRSLFTSDGYLLIPSDKSAFLNTIEKYTSEIQSQYTDCKPPSMENCADFAKAFIMVIKQMLTEYTEGRIIFDRYIENSLKEQTRKKRLGENTAVAFAISDSTNIKLVSMKTFLSSNSTKCQLTEYLRKILMREFADSEKTIVVVSGIKAYSNKPN